MSFHLISYEKIFNDAMCIQDDIYLSIFPIEFL
jgi:hypothetical protein